MSQSVKVYKPTEEEILKNVLQSFEIENIRISRQYAEKVMKKVHIRIKKGNG